MGGVYVPIVELAVACVAVTFVPLTHGVAGHLLHRDAQNSWRFWAPPFFTGGPRFILFQGFSWAFFAVASLFLALAIGQLYVSKMAVSVSAPRSAKNSARLGAASARPPRVSKERK